jgi:hypothetical protein
VPGSSVASSIGKLSGAHRKQIGEFMESDMQSNEFSEFAGFPLDKTSADALLQCMRILGSKKTAAARVTMATWARDFIRVGRWPLFRANDLPELFYPGDACRAASMQELIATARVDGRLPELISPSHVAAWPECPKVPADSPLRAWLPSSMGRGQARPGMLAGRLIRQAA